jgi:hypothetical protein
MQKTRAVTGALGYFHTAMPVIFQSPEGIFKYKIRSHKIRGRRRGAPEKRIGADAIFQIAVFQSGRKVFSKGLPFQAKIGGGFKNQKVQDQAKNMQLYFETGIVVRYSPNGYKGLDIREILTSPTFETSATAPLQQNLRPKKLGTVLGEDFLNCIIGLKSAYTTVEDQENQLLQDALVIETKVTQIEER